MGRCNSILPDEGQNKKGLKSSIIPGSYKSEARTVVCVCVLHIKPLVLHIYIHTHRRPAHPESVPILYRSISIIVERYKKLCSLETTTQRYTVIHSVALQCSKEGTQREDAKYRVIVLLLTVDSRCTTDTPAIY